ncbi:MAG: adenylate/guanylate cyclase domain-containing protein, partial [Marinovum sp.]|nr:adenylate/guanylate cyclase domain-containing protein [Marinovum sp.]
ESKGERKDTLGCIQMAINMQLCIGKLQSYLKKIDIRNAMRIRMGVSTGYRTVGDFSSPKRLEYTALGSVMNLAARLQVSAPADKILISAATHALEEDNIECAKHQMITPKGFVRPVDTFLLKNHTRKARGTDRAKYQKLEFCLNRYF